MRSRLDRTTLVIAAVLSSLLLSFGAAAADNASLWKHSVKGDFASVLANVKSSLEANQFQITGEENLSKGLENNKQVFGVDKWNTVGFQNVTAVLFCSMTFNHEAFNTNMDWAVLCPFKVVLYNMKKQPDQVQLVMVRPAVVLERDSHPKAKEIGKKIEGRIIAALKEGAQP